MPTSYKVTYKTTSCVADSNARFWDFAAHHIDANMHCKRIDVTVNNAHRGLENLNVKRFLPC